MCSHSRRWGGLRAIAGTLLLAATLAVPATGRAETGTDDGSDPAPQAAAESPAQREPQPLDPAGPPYLTSGKADPAWDAVVEEPREMRIPDLEISIARRRAAQIGAGVAAGWVTAWPSAALSFAGAGGTAVGLALYVGTTTFAVHWVGTRMVDAPGHGGWTLVGTVAGSVLGLAVSIVGFGLVGAGFLSTSALLSLATIVAGITVMAAATALPALGAVLGFEVGMRRAVRQQVDATASAHGATW